MASGWWRQANLNVARTAAGCAGTQLAAIAFGGCTSYPTAINSTEVFNGLTWGYTGALNTARGNAAGFGSSTAALFAGGISGTSYLNATEIFNGTVWTAANSLNYARDENMGGGSSAIGWTTGGYNGTSALNITEKWNGVSWYSSGNLLANRRNAAGGGVQNSAWVSAGNGPLATTEVFDGSVWASRGNNNQPRQGPCGFGASSSSGLMAGGNDGTQNSLRCELFDGNAWTNTSTFGNATGYTFRCGASGSVTGGGIAVGGDGGGGNGVATTLAWFVTLQSYSWMTQPSTITGRSYHGQAGANNQDVIVFGGTGLLSSTERWNGTAWAAGGGLSQQKNNVTGCGGATTALCIGGNSSGYLNRVESYNGSTWTTLAGTLVTARDQLGSAGDSSAALAFGGYTGSASAKCESFNGTTWSDVNVLNTARYALTGCGSQTAAISPGGAGPLKRTELWNGSTWANSGDLNTANATFNLSGTSTSARMANGSNYAQVSELWTGTAWTSSINTNIGRANMGNGPGGVSTGMMVAGGTINIVGTQHYPSEIYTGAVPITISGPIFNGLAELRLWQFFPPPFIGTGSLALTGVYRGPFFDLDYRNVVFQGQGYFETAAGIFAPFSPAAFEATGSIQADLHVGSSMLLTLPMLQFEGTLESRSGMLEYSFPALGISATGQTVNQGNSRMGLPVLTFLATGLTGQVGQGSFILSAPGISATGWPVGKATLAEILPMLQFYAHGYQAAISRPVIALNLKNAAVAEYFGWFFNSFAEFGVRHLGATETGIHILGGDKDGTADIDSTLSLGQMQMGNFRVREIWLEGRSSGEMKITVEGDETDDYALSSDYLVARLNQDRVVLPRGFKPVYLRITVANRDGCDFDLDALQAYGEVLKRKKR